MSEPEIREYAKKKAFHPQTVARWLAWEQPDRDALYRLALPLKIGENHLRDLMDWLEEISLRDGVQVRQILGNGARGWAGPTNSSVSKSRSEGCVSPDWRRRKIRFAPGFRN
ncbi:MAG: hypothetical protein HYV01_13560 [Deltaproteobacteria bacterium]|nr:hypothetical protein [Deltaproteobacteria bacterium]